MTKSGPMRILPKDGFIDTLGKRYFLSTKISKPGAYDLEQPIAIFSWLLKPAATGQNKKIFFNSEESQNEK